jgi:DNA-binding CsgD family transcriptional regulator
VLSGACEDLLSLRTLGPLRDAVRGESGTLVDALAAGDQDAVFGALHEELAGRPTVLVVEDVHWADDATLDVLRFLGRRIASLSAVLLVTYRDDGVSLGSPLRRLLGGLSGPAVRRIELRGLSAEAVERMAGRGPEESAALHRLTAGNPFFLSEVLASAEDGVPATVADAVLARVRRLAPATQRAVEQLAVVPARCELWLARAVLADIADLAEAERAQVVTVHPDAIGFRHELARRAVEGALPTLTRMALNEEVLAALLAREAPDLDRVVHHAVQAGDDAAVVEHAPEAARRACAAGAQNQGADLYGLALDRGGLLPAERRAALGQAHAWALFHANRRHEAVDAAERAVRIREELGEVGPLGWALAFLAMQYQTDHQMTAARQAGERALQVLDAVGDTVEHASALVFLAILFTVLDREREGLALADAALGMAERVGADRLRPMALLFHGRAAMELGDPDGLDQILRSMELGRSAGTAEDVMMGYLSLVPLLWRAGRFADAAQHLDRWEAEASEQEFLTHDQNRASYRFGLQAMRGEWEAAEAGLRQIVGSGEDPGLLALHALPTLARLAVRRGRDDADALLAAAREHAERAENLPVLLPVAVAEVERAWLAGRPPLARAARELLPRAEQPGRAWQRGELLRYLKRLGDPAEAFPGCPEVFAAGLRGDWRAAADLWADLGDPYERALELADSGAPEPTLEALTVLDDLGAAPAAALVRRRLRALGIERLPRGPQPTTRRNPAGLTARQVEILRLLCDGLTNAEIAERLVVSVRTVDHHVSAVLQKLGVPSRQAARAAAPDLLS